MTEFTPAERAEAWAIKLNGLEERILEAQRLLGFALFNLAKGNTAATETLVRKAYVALAGHEWDAS